MRAIDADALIDKTDDRYSLHEIGRRERDDIVDALEYAPTIQPEPHWIPVTERLPAMGKSVLMCDIDGDIYLGHRTQCGYYYPDFCGDRVKNVTAWCNLPEPYKEGSNERSNSVYSRTICDDGSVVHQRQLTKNVSISQRI